MENKDQRDIHAPAGDDKEHQPARIRRKDFLKGSLLSMLAGSSLAGMASAASAAQGERAGRKPPLNPGSLNRLLAEISEGQHPELKERAMRDWQGALREAFQLSERQSAMLATASREQVAEVQQAFNNAVKVGEPMMVRPAGGGQSPAERTDVTCSVSTGDKGVTFTCTIVIAR